MTMTADYGTEPKMDPRGSYQLIIVNRADNWSQRYGWFVAVCNTVPRVDA